jgi:TPR repeat protein
MQALFMLGALFSKGVGGQENLAEAWRWLEKSRLSGQAQSAAALERLTESISLSDLKTGKLLLAQQPRIDKDGLYANPRMRYVQTILNRTGYHAGVEDGLPGPRTDAAIAAFLRANKLPRETQILQLVEFLRGKY